MFCGHDLIKIYLMVLTITIIWNYCVSQENTAYYRNRLRINHYLQRPKQTHKRILALLSRKREFRNQQRKLDNEILHNNIELVNAQAKTDVLKLQDSYLENYSLSKIKDKDPTNSQNTDRHPEYEVRIRRDEQCNETDNNDDNKNNNQLLHEIIDELDEIRVGSDGRDDKGALCQLNGTWKSDLVGLAFTISFPKCNTTTSPTTVASTTATTTTTTTSKPLPSSSSNNNTVGDVEISTIAVAPDNRNDFQPLINCSWHIFARIPFSSNTMLIITAEYPPSKHIAVFVGQCRYCDKIEMVVGQWLVQKFALDCRKVQMAEDVFGDVLKRYP